MADRQHRSSFGSSSMHTSAASVRSLAGYSSQKSVSYPLGEGGVFCCNRCNEPVTTNIFVCSCDCLFCKDCVHAHFVTNQECCSCGTVLATKKEFTPLCIGEVPNNPPDDYRISKINYQKLFTKGNKSVGTQYMHYEDAGLAVLQMQEQALKMSRFLFRQLLKGGDLRGYSVGKIRQDHVRLQQEYTQLQQAVSTERAQSAQSLQESKHELLVVQKQLEEEQAKNQQMKQQLDAFRAHIANESRSRLPPQSSPMGSMRSGSAGSATGRQKQSTMHLQHQQPQEPPFHRQQQNYSFRGPFGQQETPTHSQVPIFRNETSHPSQSEAGHRRSYSSANPSTTTNMMQPNYTKHHSSGVGTLDPTPIRAVQPFDPRNVDPKSREHHNSNLQGYQFSRGPRSNTSTRPQSRPFSSQYPVRRSTGRPLNSMDIH